MPAAVVSDGPPVTTAPGPGPEGLKRTSEETQPREHAYGRQEKISGRHRASP